MKGTIDKVWEDIHSVQEWGQYPTEHVIRFVARNFYKVPNRSEIKILDFGLGGGAHTWYLAREGFDAYGFDGSPSAVKKAKQKLEKENLFANIICATGQEVKYQKDFFDAIIDNVCVYANVLEDISLMYNKIYSFLRTGGKLFTTTFGKKTTGYGTGIKIEEDTFTNLTEGNLVNRGVTHFFEKESFLSLLKKCGFKNLNCDTDLYTNNGNVVEILIATGEK